MISRYETCRGTQASPSGGHKACTRETKGLSHGVLCRNCKPYLSHAEMGGKAHWNFYPFILLEI
jgi:hypothetical protein